MGNLTKNQAEVYKVLKDWIEQWQQAPTVTELQYKLRELGMKVESKRSITQYLEALESKGLITRSGEARGIQLSEPLGEVLLNIPIMGLANAGVATVFADEYQAGVLRISKKLLKKSHNIFALEVKGNSLNKADINGQSPEDGDWVIIDKDYKEPKDGDYILSIIDGMANLKKFYFDNEHKRIVLSSESTENIPPIFIHPEDTYSVNGKIIQVIKRPQ